MKLRAMLLLGGLALVAGACKTRPAKTTAPTQTSVRDVSARYLPDLDPLFDAYDSLTKRDQHRDVAALLMGSNRDLRASQLYVYAATHYCKANLPDSAAAALHQAIDNGMADPYILNKEPALEGVKKASGWSQLESRLAAIRQDLGRQERFAVRTEPLETFWPYFDQALADTLRARDRFKAYILKGSPAVRDYYVARYLNTNRMYDRMVRKSPDYYRYLKTYLNGDSLRQAREQTARMMTRFAGLYREAVFPDVNIMPGILNSGGTATEVGLFIGGDMFGKSEGMPTQGFDEWNKSRINRLGGLPLIIVHELMHFQQHYRDYDHANKVLGQVISEGVCDFLAELCSGETLRDDKVRYLEQPANRDFILAEFKKEMFTENTSNWLYNGSIKDRPVDIGYTLGYKIAKSYYERSADKQTAIYNLLNADSFATLVRESEYGYLLDDSPPPNTK
ncbi:MAG: hypothetical protein ICV83_23745 [Cytophagales bacterium]|nr:hypothetical protein [Cytophagales bacterium]